ncbi:MAG: hypothetical protein PHC69_00210 [Ruminiclostridium sp.]|nr:hypothetical protein [Ruminiclostridium sp.]
MGDKTKEQLLKELSDVQQMLEEKTEMQGKMIKRFQMLVANEALFSQIIDFFPYPIAIFTPEYKLFMVNKAFVSETKTELESPGEKTVRILQYKIDDTQLAVALTRVFSGNTFFKDGVKDPFSMFSGIKRQGAPQPDHFSKVIIFPVPADDAEITHGVIVFM